MRVSPSPSLLWTFVPCCDDVICSGAKWPSALASASAPMLKQEPHDIERTVANAHHGLQTIRDLGRRSKVTGSSRMRIRVRRRLATPHHWTWYTNSATALRSWYDWSLG